MIVTKRVEGEVNYNDGEFAEVRTVGIEGIENGLWLGTMQIHRAKAEHTPDEFIPSGWTLNSPLSIRDLRTSTQAKARNSADAAGRAQSRSVSA